MLYLLLIPVSLAMLIELRSLLSLRKHDRVLFPFCHLRSDLLAFLRDHSGELSREDYVYARRMLTALNHTVSIYRHHKGRFFNFRAFARFLRAYQSSATEIEKIPRTERRELQQLEGRLNDAMFHGFMCYTPFLRSEFVARLLIALIGVAARLGLRIFATRTREMKDLITTVRGQAAHFGESALRTA